MRNMTWFIVIAFIASSCSSSTKVMTPEGKDGYAVHCYTEKSKCFSEAAKTCPQGYNIINDSNTAGSYISSKSFDILISCK